MTAEVSRNLSDLKVAIVHYWFVSRRGGERVVEALCELFPQADLFSLVVDPDVLLPALQTHKLTVSFLQKLPWSRHCHRYLLPLYPLAVEQFDLRGYDLVISSESGPAKGVITGPDTLHICYCHTPMRYLWDFYGQYKTESGLGSLGQLVFGITSHYLRLWDQASASRVDCFVANSENVARRIYKFYKRGAEVIYPPVDVDTPEPTTQKGSHYLVAGQLVRYKRVDLAIEACNKLGRPLRIVGVGEEERRLRKLAGQNIEFLGNVSDNQLRHQYASCRALLFPGEEDFGMVPVEAQSAGRPVIALEKGGARETVIPVFNGNNRSPEVASGIFFQEQSVAGVMEAIRMFETVEERFSPDFIRAQAQRFNKQTFQRKMATFVRDKLQVDKSNSI